MYFGDAGSSAVLHSLGAQHAACAVITLDTPGVMQGEKAHRGMLGVLAPPPSSIGLLHLPQKCFELC